MAHEDIPTALRQFGQIDSALNRKYEGTGLGLPLTKALIEMHGGALELESRLGEGTTAILRLPAWRIVAPAHRQDVNAFIESRKDSFRSEEHTSELQSLMRISYAVFCLKKKKQ